MRCLFTSTADSYDIAAFYAMMSPKLKTSLIRGVVHIEFPTHFETGNIFYFGYGCIVCWGLSTEEEQRFINEIKPFEQKPLKQAIVDVFTYQKGDANKIVNGEIILADRTALTLLAVSHGFAQSVKLDAFENRIQRTYNLVKHIPEQMAAKGRVLLSKQEIRKKMGELFIERSSINLHFDVLDTPEFFWEYPEYEPLYMMIYNYLDLQNRVEVLNQRLRVVHELFEMLDNELNHQHSSRLEWTIIILILMEVTITIFKDVLNWI